MKNEIIVVNEILYLALKNRRPLEVVLAMNGVNLKRDRVEITYNSDFGINGVVLQKSKRPGLWISPDATREINREKLERQDRSGTG